MAAAKAGGPCPCASKATKVLNGDGGALRKKGTRPIVSSHHGRPNSAITLTVPPLRIPRTAASLSSGSGGWNSTVPSCRTPTGRVRMADRARNSDPLPWTTTPPADAADRRAQMYDGVDGPAKLAP